MLKYPKDLPKLRYITLGDEVLRGKYETSCSLTMTGRELTAVRTRSSDA